MLSINDLSDRIAALALEGAPIDEFAIWLRKASYNIHLWGSEEIQSAVLAVEAILSEYQFADLGEGETRRELANCCCAASTYSKVC